MHNEGYIIIDTEGTGLFRLKNADGTTCRSDEPGQPRMAEFAAVIADKDLNFEYQYRSYISPLGWSNIDGSPMEVMPEGAFNVHGLSMDFLRANGGPVEMALAVYTRAINEGRAVLGFNQQHDGRQVRAEMRHCGLDDMFEKTLTCCAMRSMTAAGIKVTKLNGKRGWPGLVDAAAHFGIDYPSDRRHTALEDAKVTLQISRQLHRTGQLLMPEVHRAKDSATFGENVS